MAPNGDCCKCPPPAPSGKSSPDTSCKPPEIMVCYRVPKGTGGATKGGNNEKEKPKQKKDDEQKVKPSKSRELRCGILYIGCDCEKLNGLQDDCRRSECRGAPACLTSPKPTCGPSEFSNGKHLLKKGRKKQENKGLATVDGTPNSANAKNNNELTEEYICYPACIDASDSPPCAC